MSRHANISGQHRRSVLHSCFESSQAILAGLTSDVICAPRSPIPSPPALLRSQLLSDDLISPIEPGCSHSVYVRCHVQEYRDTSEERDNLDMNLYQVVCHSLLIEPTLVLHFMIQLSFRLMISGISRRNAM